MWFRTASSSNGTTANTPAENASCRDRSKPTRSGPPLPGRLASLFSHTREFQQMNVGLFAQYAMNGLMLGMMYALVAVGFTLFFGVLDVIKFSHGDVLTVGAFTALAAFTGLSSFGFKSQWFDLAIMLALATLMMALLGMLIARYLVMPLR